MGLSLEQAVKRRKIQKQIKRERDALERIVTDRASSLKSGDIFEAFIDIMSVDCEPARVIARDMDCMVLRRALLKQELKDLEEDMGERYYE